MVFWSLKFGIFDRLVLYRTEMVLYCVSGIRQKSKGSKIFENNIQGRNPGTATALQHLKDTACWFRNHTYFK